MSSLELVLGVRFQLAVLFVLIILTLLEEQLLLLNVEVERYLGGAEDHLWCRTAKAELKQGIRG